MTTFTYLYIVYENYRHYKEYNKFYEINLTTNQVEVKERYIEKDNYMMEFFEVPTEYAEKVYKYVQEKFIKSPFPINVRSGELQSTCKDFIKKCNTLKQEKNLSVSHIPESSGHPLLLPPPLPTTKVIVLLSNKENGEVTVISNDDNTDNIMFCQQLHRHANTIQVLQSAQ